LSDDFPATIKALRGYALRLDSGATVSFGDLVDSLETPVRNDGVAARASPPIEPAPPISADADGDEPDELDQAVATAEEMNDRLAAVEAAQQHDDFAATLERLENRTADLDERTASIEEAIASGDVQRLAELMDEDLGEA
jgi:chromosome segregation ATPase